MNSLIRQFYSVGESEEPQFKEILFLTEDPKADWVETSKKSPRLPRGWFELSRLSSCDRVEFTRDFWLDHIPFNPNAHTYFYEFFEQLDDVGVILSRKGNEEVLIPELVYSLEDNSTFFRGRVPGSEAEIEEMKNEIGLSLPRDYLSFLRIHNGFGKLSEMGLLEIGEIAEGRRRVMELLLGADKVVKSGRTTVDPGSLIPFYEVLGLSSFQCFYADWYAGNEMGNVYLSGIDYTISDVSATVESLAFPTFSEWLVYYLQGMNLSP